MSLPFWHFLFSRDGLARLLADSLAVTAGAALPVLLLLQVSSAAAANPSYYLDAQLIKSLTAALERMDAAGPRFTWFSRYAAILPGAGIVVTGLLWGRPGRDEAVLPDVYAITEVVDEQAIIGLGPGSEPWTLYEAYFARYGKISLDRRDSPREMLLVPVDREPLPAGYAACGPRTMHLRLVKRKGQSEARSPGLGEGGAPRSQPAVRDMPPTAGISRRRIHRISRQQAAAMQASANKRPPSSLTTMPSRVK